MALVLMLLPLGWSLLRPANAETAILYLTETRPAAAQAEAGAHDIGVDGGVLGARLGIADNNASAAMAGEPFALKQLVIEPNVDVASVLQQIGATGANFVVSDLDAATLVPIVRSAGAARLLFINSRARDDALRTELCADNLLHTIASRAMLADGLAQYLAARRWRRWFLVLGRSSEDRLFAAAVRRSAARFGAAIAIEKTWPFTSWNARADTGHLSLQSDIPAFTRVDEHDVLVVANETGDFGDYLEGRTTLPRPIAGTHGITATEFSVVNEQWGATQLHGRFARLAGRRMAAIEYAAWAAVRSIGEAVLRLGTSEPRAVIGYLRGPDFLLSGFKGQGQTFRPWNGQMRQPILITGTRMLITTSPQAGYLQRGSALDTLGFDREETSCR